MTRRFSLAAIGTMLLLCAVAQAVPPAAPAKWTLALPDAGTYSYWVQSHSGAIMALPTTVTARKSPIPLTVAAGDTLCVLDAHTGQVAVRPVVAPGPVALTLADFKPLSAAPAPTAPAAPAPAKPEPLPEEHNGVGQFFSWLLGLIVAAGVLWFLWRLYQTRGQPLLLLARKMGVDVPDPKPTDPNADAPPPVYEAPKPRPIEKIPDEAGASAPPRTGPRRSSPSPPLLGPATGVPQLVGTQGLAAGSTFAITDGTVFVGRDGDNDIVLAESTVSRRHARLVRDDMGQITLMDEGSANGVYVNGARVPQATLAHGDEVKIGDNYFRFEA